LPVWALPPSGERNFTPMRTIVIVAFLLAETFGASLFAAPQDQTPKALPPVAAAPSLPGKYFRHDKTSDYFELKTDGTFHLLQDRKNYNGNYKVLADTITVQGKHVPANTIRFLGNALVDPNGTVWEKQPANSDPPGEPIVQQPVQPVQPVEPAQPAEPPTIKLGDSTGQVASSMGQPDRIAKVGNKEIYFYKDMKITFVSGKVSDIQ